MKAITETEILGEMVAKRVPLNKIRNLCYEAGRRQAKDMGFRGSAISRWGGEQVRRLDLMLDSIFL